jgi:hypothetical protein
MQITLKGLGAVPRLCFDRREIIMPIVPLGVTSRCIFRVVNEGYESLTLRHHISIRLWEYKFRFNVFGRKNCKCIQNKVKKKKGRGGEGDKKQNIY